jgi:hypothetical protein
VSIASAMNSAMLSRASTSSVCCASQPAVVLVGPGVRPRRRDVDLGDEGVHHLDEALDLGLGDVGGREDVAGEAGGRAVGRDVHALAVAPARVGREPEVVEGGDERRLIGRDPLPAELEHRPVDRLGAQASADPVAGLEHRDGQAGVAEVGGGGEPGGSGADDDDVAGEGLGHDVCSVSGGVVGGAGRWGQARRGEACALITCFTRV